MRVSYDAFRAYMVARSLTAQGCEDNEAVYLQLIDGSMVLECQVSKTNPADTVNLSDFTNSVKPTWNAPVGYRDSDGAMFTRGKMSKVGWRYCPIFIEFTTAKYGALHFNTFQDTPIAEASMSFWDGDTQLLRANYESDALFQQGLDALCDRTHIDWQSTYNFDPRAAAFIMGAATPSSPTYLWTVIAPDIAANLGGSVAFNVGGVPLHLLAPFSVTMWDGMTVKSVAYDPVYNSNKFRQIIRHDAGSQINGCFAIQLYRG